MLTNRKRNRTVLYSFLYIIAIVHIYPILLILLSAFKTKPDLAQNPFGFPKEITFEHFFGAIKTMMYLRVTLNTIFIVFVSVGITLFITSMAAYAITRRKKKVYDKIYMYFLAGMIIPFQMTMIPLYSMMVKFKFVNTYGGVILIYLAALAPFSIFLFSGFIKTIPKDLEEAALIDGCGVYSTFFKIVFPLLKPVVATVAILNIFNLWNDFLMPTLFLTDRGKKTLIVQLYSFIGRYFNNWSLIFASIFLIIYPVLIIYIFAQKYIISGITAGALKS